jgi:hypothetical protein
MQSSDGSGLPRQGLVVLHERDVTGLRREKIRAKELHEMAPAIGMPLGRDLDHVGNAASREVHLDGSFVLGICPCPLALGPERSQGKGRRIASVYLSEPRTRTSLAPLNRKNALEYI